ncbi:MAG: ACP S-malonyltransferase [Candidatus Omnitrophota bacterium]
MKAVIFPGQGSQYTGMGKSLYDGFSAAGNIFSSVNSILGYELSKKCFKAEEAELKDTLIQQLAILTVSLAAYEAFKTKNIKVDYLAGLSLGEYSCLYAAEVVNLEGLVTLVKERAQAMQKASRTGSSTMFAVLGVDRDIVEEKAKQGNFYIANINSPKQIVISLARGNREEIRGLFEACGAKVIELEVSGGFHSFFMEPAKERLKKVIEEIEFEDAKIPIVSNFTAAAHVKSEEIKNNLIQQLVSPVLWNDCVEFMAAKGVDLFFEVGPSKTLRGLIRKINPQLKVVNIEKKEDILG